jgi:hypothetical protein
MVRREGNGRGKTLEAEMWSGGRQRARPRFVASRPAPDDHRLVCTVPSARSASVMDSSEAYYPPPASWNFAAPSVLSEWDARSEAAASPLGEANFLRSAEWCGLCRSDGRRLESGLTADFSSPRSPDGTAILTTAEDRTVRIFDL